MKRSNDDLVDSFVQLAPERVARATELWLSIEEGATGHLPELRRLLHTLKGEAYMLGMEEIGGVSEISEDIIELVDRGGKVSSEVGSALLSALEVIAFLASTPAVIPDEVTQVRAELEAVRARLRELAATSRRPGTTQALHAAAEAEPGAAVETEHEQSTHGEQSPTQMLDVEGLRALVDELRRLHSEQALLQPELRETQRMLRALLAEIDPGMSPETVAERIVKTLGYGAQIERKIASIRAQWSANTFASGMSLEQLDDQVRKAALVTTTKLKGLIHRLGRTTAHALGKEVQIDFAGAAYLDAAIEQRLAPALLHLVRNAIDHGIEDRDVRKARLKPPRGRVAVSIEQTESHVQVVVEDDGGGIDLEALRERLEDTNPDAASYSDDELIAQIFEHGVTTRTTATAISGRGVGLDVVAREVRNASGNLHVETNLGRGTRFVLTMPTTLRADLVVPVTVGQVRFAIPSRSVAEVRRLEKLERTSDGHLMRIRRGGTNKLAPVYPLSGIVGDGGEPHDGDAVLVVDHGSMQFGLGVDAYDNPRLMSFQPIDMLACRSSLVRGVAPSADGGVFLLLDVAAIQAVLSQRKRAAASAPEAPKRAFHAFVAEDSPIARELLSGILRTFGLRVSSASDGREALHMLRSAPPDIILTDIEMPYLDGLQLIAEIRKDPNLAALPVVVLTTRTDESTRARATALGVQGFLSKQRFVETEVRHVVDRCLGFR